MRVSVPQFRIFHGCILSSMSESPDRSLATQTDDTRRPTHREESVGGRPLEPRHV